MNVEKGLISDDVLSRYLAVNRTKSTGSGRKTSVLTGFGQVRRVPLYDNALDNSAFVFIQDVLDHPDDGVKARYKRLGLSAGSGNRLKEQLLSAGWLEDQVVEIGQTRKLLLRVARAGKDALGLDDKKSERASLVHEYWKRFYAQRFCEQGYKALLEALRRSGNVDVLALKDGKSIAIEVETGKSDVVRNVKEDLLSGFDKILVVATDARALRKVEQELAHAGLIIPNKVDVALRDQIADC